MKKMMFTVAVALAGITCLASPGFRIDLEGAAEKVAMKPAGCDEGIILEAEEYTLIASNRQLTDKWQKFEFSFIPDKDGLVKIIFNGHPDKESPQWVAYDNITVTGTKAKNGDFEFVNQHNLFDGWSGSPANMVVGKRDAQSGNNYVIAWRKNPVFQKLNLTKNQKVTIVFHARAATGKESDIGSSADQK